MCVHVHSIDCERERVCVHVHSIHIILAGCMMYVNAESEREREREREACAHIPTRHVYVNIHQHSKYTNTHSRFNSNHTNKNPLIP